MLRPLRSPAFPVMLAVTIVVSSFGCSGRERTGGGRGSDGGGSGDAAIGDGGSGPVSDGAAGNDCVEAARWVYLVDDAGRLIRFEPDSLTFTSVGTLDCPAGGSSPFSMSVDRDATAWVLFQDGHVYHASTADASCTATGFAPNQAGLELFGMGFVADSAGSDAETLFVAGGSSLSVGSGASQLAWIDATGLTLTPIGSLPGWPELTGTGDGELWGFFPDTRPTSIRQIDEASAGSLRTFDLDALGSVSPLAWAFAFWGGRFYVFLMDLFDPSTNVWRLDPETGDFIEVLHDSGYQIVGAGVSTCAPVELI